VNDLHMVQSGVVLPEHLDLFERGVAKKLDYAYSGPQSARIATMLIGGKIELGAVHTYLELFARYFIDLTANVALIAAVSADRDGVLYTGPNTEDTPTVVEATAFKDGIVVAQVNEIVAALGWRPPWGFPASTRSVCPPCEGAARDAPDDAEAARVEACALIAALEDTNLLHRAGLPGLQFARRASRHFLDHGGVGRPGWRERARAVLENFIARSLSPGGSADLLAMTLFVEANERRSRQ
jgi:malonate decarboxylase alpha subunit/ATP:dephospho-CoA triphosphoribosyl transferase